MQIKTTTSLFKGKYQYKIVLVCPGAQYFRGTMDEAIEQLNKIDLARTSPIRNYRNTHIRTQEQLDYAFKLQKTLGKLKDIDIRVESPWISIYSNNLKDIESLVKLDTDCVKYVSKPSENTNLEAGVIVMPKMDYDYRITLGKTTQAYEAFVSWAENSAKVKLTKSCKRDLLRNRTWGGTHFYVKGDKNLLVCRMHLGGNIAKLERIVKN